jgi:hypothetical protein
MVELADRLLGREGRLIEVVAAARLFASWRSGVSSDYVRHMNHM